MLLLAIFEVRETRTDARAAAKVLLERKSGYYISNVVVPLSLLTILGKIYFN